MTTQTLETALYCPGIAIGYELHTDLEELERRFAAEHQPATPTERALVDSLVYTEWMLRRYRWLETEVWNTARQSLPPDPRPASWPGRAFIAQPLIARIHRLRASTNRGFLDTLTMLRRLQADRRAPDPAPPVPPAKPFAIDSESSTAPPQQATSAGSTA